jgi:hypothetical protein
VEEPHRFFVVLATGWRALPLLKGFLKANSWEWKRFVIVQQTTEVARDVAFLGRSVVIICCGYSALNYIMEMTDILAAAHTFVCFLFSFSFVLPLSHNARVRLS